MRFRPSVFMLVIPCAILHSLGMDIFVSGIPEMVRELHSNDQSIQYLLALFMLGTGMGQPIAGICCDGVGRRVTMLVSIGVFIMASWAATCTNSIAFISLFRFIAGLGASGTLVSTYSIINDRYHGREAHRMFSLLGCSLALAPMLAPLLGVYLMSLFGGWKACFYFLALFAGVSCLLTMLYLPETKPHDTLVPRMPTIVTHYYQIMTNHSFLLYTLLAMLALSQLYLYFSVGNILLIHRMGLSPSLFSMVFAVNAILFLLGGYVSTKLQKIYPVVFLARVSVVIMLLGSMIMLFFYEVKLDQPFSVIVSNALMTLGVGIVMGPATGAALQPFKSFAGTASGLFATLQYSGAALVGFIATRFEIQSSLSISLPMFILSAATLLLLFLPVDLQGYDASH